MPDMTVLRTIANATAANTVHYVTGNEGKPLLDAGLIDVDFNNKDADGRVAARVTNAGVEELNKLNGHDTQAATKPVHTYQVQSGGLELPKVERGFKKGVGGGGAPSKYPFDTMQVNDYIFVPDSDVKNNDAVKTMGSAAGSANQRYAKGTGEHEVVQRAKRGPDHKAIKDPEGKIVRESVTVEKKEFTRKFVVRPVKAGVQYGNFVAPADGAVVVRTC